MFKQVFRLTFITFVWKKYKRIIASTIFLFAYLWLVGYVHDEYLEIARLQEQNNIGLSFMVKWLALLSGAVIYLVFNLLGTKSRKNSVRQVPAESDGTEANDPFAELRTRKKLRSKAEMIIEKEID